MIQLFLDFENINQKSLTYEFIHNERGNRRDTTGSEVIKENG